MAPRAEAPVWLRQHWWRLAFLAATLVLAALSWHDTLVAAVTVVPVLIWCTGVARSGRAGLVAGLILLAVAVWILLPRVLGWSGPWVPSVFDVCVFLPVLTAVVCGIGVLARTVALAVFAVAGLLIAGYTAVWYSEGVTGTEGVWPAESGLRVVEGERLCGSGGCARQFDATGEHAPERLRAYFESRGFTTPGFGDGWLCRISGLVFTYRVCAEVRAISPTTARVTVAI